MTRKRINYIQRKINDELDNVKKCLTGRNGTEQGIKVSEAMRSIKNCQSILNGLEGDMITEYFILKDD